MTRPVVTYPVDRPRGAPIPISHATIRGGDVEFRISGPGKVSFITPPDKPKPLFFGHYYELMGDIEISSDLYIRNGFTPHVFPAMERPDLYDEKNIRSRMVPGGVDPLVIKAAHDVVHDAWIDLVAGREEEIHQARHDLVDDIALRCLGDRETLLEKIAAIAPGTPYDVSGIHGLERASSRCAEEVDEATKILLDRPGGLKDRPGYLVVKDGAPSPIGLEADGSGWIADHVHAYARPAFDHADIVRGVVHRVRIVRGELRIVTPKGFADGFFGAGARPWPAEPLARAA